MNDNFNDYNVDHSGSTKGLNVIFGEVASCLVAMLNGQQMWESKETDRFHTTGLLLKTPNHGMHVRKSVNIFIYNNTNCQFYGTSYETENRNPNLIPLEGRQSDSFVSISD